ncbi:hypothetical protein [Lentzea albida]|uniref:hypothetical protein n=1 Tax=Lentzea albida TaxID=65499 RepID=UPI000B7DB000|nr:hypothetical protein [Lentzea albida]
MDDEIDSLFRVRKHLRGAEPRRGCRDDRLLGDEAYHDAGLSAIGSFTATVNAGGQAFSFTFG